MKRGKDGRGRGGRQEKLGEHMKEEVGGGVGNKYLVN